MQGSGGPSQDIGGSVQWEHPDCNELWRENDWKQTRDREKIFPGIIFYLGSGTAREHA